MFWNWKVRAHFHKFSDIQNSINYDIRNFDFQRKKERKKERKKGQQQTEQTQTNIPISHQDLLASTTKEKAEKGEWNRIWTTTNRNPRHGTPKNTKQQYKQKGKASYGQTSNRTLQDHTRIPPDQNRTTLLTVTPATNKSPPNTCYMNAENTETQAPF